MPQDIMNLTQVPAPGQPVFNASAASGTLADIVVNSDCLSAYMVVAPITGGAAPTITFTINGVDAFGNTVVVIAGTAVPAAGGQQIFSVGPGMGNIANVSLPHI